MGGCKTTFWNDYRQPYFDFVFLFVQIRVFSWEQPWRLDPSVPRGIAKKLGSVEIYLFARTSNDYLRAWMVVSHGSNTYNEETYSYRMSLTSPAEVTYKLLKRVLTVVLRSLISPHLPEHRAVHRNPAHVFTTTLKPSCSTIADSARTQPLLHDGGSRSSQAVPCGNSMRPMLSPQGPLRWVLAIMRELQ